VSSFSRVTMQTTGTVQFFDVIEGYGLISPRDGSNEVFVHISEVEYAGLNTLLRNQKVEFDLERSPEGRILATNLRVL
jgi:cold shock protein